MKVNDALATVEEIARGDGAVRTAPFDIVFVDADKTRLLEYVEACVTSDKLLKKGGLIVVDNVLWKGLVLSLSGDGMSQSDIDKEEDGLDDKALKKNRRARKLAGLMHKFNTAVVQDDRLEVVLLPIRDGLSIIRKK
jgi:caffeoyl-CoA O-methyltransferase